MRGRLKPANRPVAYRMPPRCPLASRSRSAAVTGWKRKTWPTWRMRPRRGDDLSQRPALGHAGSEGLLHEAVLAGPKALARQGPGGCRRASPGPPRRHGGGPRDSRRRRGADPRPPSPQRPGAPRIGPRPRPRPRARSSTRRCFSPQRPSPIRSILIAGHSRHRRGAPRPRSGAGDPSSSGRPGGPRRPARRDCRSRTWTDRSGGAGG